MLDIVDAVTLAGSRNRPNEDAFGRAANRVWVIDGATGLGDPIVSLTSDAAWLAARASQFFSARAALEDTRAMMALVGEDLQVAFMRERRREPFERWEIPCGAFMMLTVREGDRYEFAWLGDCRAILVGDGGDVKTFGATEEGEAREAAGAANYAIQDPAARYRSPKALEALRAGRGQYNMPGRPAILAPDVAFAANVHIAEVDCPRPANALLMTDGFAALELRYGDLKGGAFVAAALQSGLARLGMRLRKFEEDIDPEASQWPRWKRSDDATAALISIT